MTPAVSFAPDGTVAEYRTTWADWLAHHAAVLDIARPAVVVLTTPPGVRAVGGYGDTTEYALEGCEWARLGVHDKAWFDRREVRADLLKTVWPGVVFTFEGEQP